MKSISITNYVKKIKTSSGNKKAMIAMILLGVVLALLFTFGFGEKQGNQEQKTAHFQQTGAAKKPNFNKISKNTTIEEASNYEDETVSSNKETIEKTETHSKNEDNFENITDTTLDELYNDGLDSASFEETIEKEFEEDALRQKNINLIQALASEISVPCNSKYLVSEENKIKPSETITVGEKEKNDNEIFLDDRQHSLTPFELRMGSVIPSVLETSINSELPGIITAIVTQDIFDSATGRQLLIPRGSKLIGTYESEISYGQSRVMAAWDRINFPDASFVDLPNMPSGNFKGESGFKDKVNNHYFKIFSSAAMLSLITAGVNMAIPDSSGENKVRDEVTGELAKNLGQVASEMLRRNMSISPTIEIRQGHEFNIMVSRDVRFSKAYETN